MKRYLFALLLAASFAARADLGDADPSFGEEGTATLPVATCNFCSHFPAKLLHQPDGKIVVMSTVVSAGSHGFSTFSVQVSRLMPDGSVDPAFNGGAARHVMGGGWLSYRFGDPGGAIGLQGDGKIVVADINGTCSGFSCTQELGVARLMPDGTPDPAFGTNGLFSMAGGGRSAAGLGIRPDGKIVVGYRGGGFSIYQLTPAGALDSGFGNAGVVSVTLPNEDGNPLRGGAFSLLPDGRMVVARYLDLAVGRLLADGTPDATFNGSGFATFGLLGTAMLARSDGSVFLGASETSGNGGRVLKVASNGQLDAAWGQAGVRTFGESFQLTNLGMQADGRLVAFGSTLSRAAFRRWRADGSTDPTLRGAGYAISNVPYSASALGMDVVGDQVVAGVGTKVARFGGTIDVLGSHRTFVEQQFRDFLGRPGDAAGIDYLTSRLASGGMSRAELVRQFLESPEFQANVAPVVRLYLAYFLRFPDYVGLLYWSDQVRQGSLGAVSAAFANSPEFQQRYGNLDNTQFVNLVYNNVLGRQPDAAGLAHWRGELDSGRMSRGNLMTAFSESAEYFGVSYNEVLVAMTYAGLFRRAADAEGFAHWVNQLDAGASPTAFIDLFVTSQEYRSRFDP